MRAKYKTNTNVGVGLGLVFQIAGFVGPVSGGPVGVILLVLGLALFIWGCVNYALGKGYPGLLGLIGVTGLLGLIIMVLLPDKRKRY